MRNGRNERYARADKTHLYKSWIRYLHGLGIGYFN